MPYYNPYQSQSPKTSFGDYANTSAVGNIGGGRSYAQRAYGEHSGQPRGGAGSYENPYSRQFNAPQQQQQQQYNPFTSYQDRSFIRGGVPANASGGNYADGYGQNPFAQRPGGGGVGGLSGPRAALGRGNLPGGQQQGPYQAWNQRMQALPGMQQAFGAMGFNPQQQQGMFQEYLNPALGNLLGRSSMQMHAIPGQQNPFALGL